MERACVLRSVVAVVLMALCLPALAAPATHPAGTGAVSITDAYRHRLVHVRQQLPEITRAAETAAHRWLERKQVLFHFPFGGDASNFTMEFIARAGGLDNFSLTTMRVEDRSANDVIVYGVRSWEKGGDFLKKDAPTHHKNGWMTVVFASKAGAPPAGEVPIDILIDNGAATGGDDEAALNQIVNMTNAWIWACELAAALTREGVHPGVLRGMPVPGAPEQLKQYQTLKPTLYPCETKIPAGKLANDYLAAVEAALADLESDDMQAQIARAADIAAKHVAAGKTLWASSFTHVLDGEVFLNNKSPFKAFRGISHNDGKNFEPMGEGDLLFWFGEWTLNMPWTDYLAFIRREKVRYIPCWRPSPEKMEDWDKPEVFHDQKVDDAEMILEQRWPFENAVVEVPFSPGKMAPLSGVYLCLQYRLLDEAIAARLAESAAAPAVR